VSRFCKFVVLWSSKCWSYFMILFYDLFQLNSRFYRLTNLLKDAMRLRNLSFENILNPVFGALNMPVEPLGLFSNSRILDFSFQLESKFSKFFAREICVFNSCGWDFVIKFVWARFPRNKNFKFSQIEFRNSMLHTISLSSARQSLISAISWFFYRTFCHSNDF